MIQNEILPYAIAYGVDEKTFWHLNPKTFKIYKKAYKIKQKQTDEYLWIMGQYCLNAVSVALDHAFNGIKAKSKYVHSPFLNNLEIEELTLKEKQEREFKHLELQAKINMANMRLAERQRQLDAEKTAKEKDNG